MDVWRITVAAARRWYILLPLLALTALVAVLAGNGVRPEYDIAGTAMVEPGRVVTDQPNPYGEAADANAALGVVLSSADARNQIAAQRLNPNYEVTTVPRSAILNYSVRADTRSSGVATGQALIRIAAAELETRQSAAGVPAAARYSLSVLQPPAVSGTVQTGKLRIMAIIGVLGAGLSLLIAVFFDDLVGIVRRARQEQRPRTKPEQSRNGVRRRRVPAGRF
jgi:hypothetical protein